jgi:hypothetical protein
MSGIKMSDLAGGGPFRWLVRLVVGGSLVIILALRLLLHMNIFLAILIGTSVFMLGLLITWLLLISGRVKVKL